MKRESLLNLASVFGVAALLVAATSCEWDRANDDATWNDAYESKYEWVNFSGVYQSTGGWYLVSEFTTPSTGSSTGGVSGGGTTVSDVQSFEWSQQGTGVNTIFGGTFTGRPLPIMPGTVSISGRLPGGDVETFSDIDRDGRLHSTQGDVLLPSNIGFINYYTGAWSVRFQFAPDLGEPITITYISASGSITTGTNTTTIIPVNPPNPGSTEPIYQFSIFQDGFRLVIRDNYGNLYEGRLIEVSSTAGGVATDIRPGQAVTVIATFEATGNGTMLSGTLEGRYTAAAEDTTIDPAELANPTGVQSTDYRGTLDSRVIRGVWMEHNGTTGELEGYSETPVQISGSTL